MTRDQIIARLAERFGPGKSYDHSARDYLPDGDDAQGQPYVRYTADDGCPAFRVATYADIADALAEPVPEPLAADGPAPELRAASRLIRERAARVPPSPWFLVESHVSSAISADRECLNVIASAVMTDRARFMALWQPDRALAVADWLDATAQDAETDLTYEDGPEGPCCADPATCRGHEPCWFCDRCGNDLGADRDPCTCWDAALAVARSYLGETQ